MSKMSELHADIQQAEALMGDDLPPKPKLCIDCKHCLLVIRKITFGDDERYYTCENPRLITYDVVEGRPQKNRCHINRIEDRKCGIDGKYWEPKYGTEKP